MSKAAAAPQRSGEEVVVKDDEYLERYGFSDSFEYKFKTKKGLSEDIVREISEMKNEPEWMLEKRLTGYKQFLAKPTPQWGGNLNNIDYNDIYYYLKPTDKKGSNWESVPEEIKKTFDKLGIPEAERKFFAGAEAQYDSEVVYSHIREDLEKQGVIFTSTDEAVKKYPELMKKYFGTVIPPSDNKFAALNTATWSGGSFIYVPKGVKLKMPLQAYFRINTEKAGQFERTLIIADEGADVVYVEGCTAPVYMSSSLHSAVVELVAHKDAHIRYVTIQNWSKNVYNLVTQRAYAYENAHVEWVDFNIGCLVKGTSILTNNDVKSIEDLNPGDRVYSLSQEFEIDAFNVVAKRENPPTDVYRLRTINHREIVATRNHPVLRMHKDSWYNKISWTPIESIKEGDLVAISGDIPDRGKPYKITGIERVKKARNHINIPKETNEDLMWLLGVYLRDGCMEKARVNIAVPLTNASNQKVRSLLKSVFGADTKQYKVTIRVGSMELVKFIKSMGLSGNARTKRIPDWIYKLPKAQKLAFIEGYLAADGHIKRGHKNVSITSTNRALLEQLKALSISCGLNPGKISKWTSHEQKPLGKEKKEYTHYCFCFSDHRLDMPIYFVPVSKIEYAGKEITYDIEVDGPHNFIANGIFVHNSKLNMKYPSIFLKEKRARGEIMSVAVAGPGQMQDSGGKIYHLAPDTTSQIISKSVSSGNGVSNYRGLLHIAANAANVKSSVRCDALLLDEDSKTSTFPYMEVKRDDATITHEASTGKVGEEQLFYLMSRGMSEEDALTTIVLGFLDPLARTLPLEYSIELRRLIKLDMSNSVG
jgi:Fe-S cluster assembly scaffold protein SufB